MSFLTRVSDTVYTVRFLKLLTTPWNKLDAFKYGIISDKGDILKKSSELKTSDEKSSYTMFHRLVFNLKKLLEKVPLGKTRIASYAAALYLIKEETGMSEDGICQVLKNSGYDKLEQDLNENTWFLDNSNKLQKGTYYLTKDCPLLSTNEFRAHQGTTVTVMESTSPIGTFRKVPVFSVLHCGTKQKIAVTTEDLSR